MTAPNIVLLTGGSSGIGLATAERLAKDPQKRFLVIATVHSLNRKSDLVAAVGDALEKTIFIKKLDVTKDDQIQSVVEDVVKEHGRLDILLNIAGVAVSGFIDTMSRDHIELMFHVNTIGLIRLVQAVLPQMKRQKAGKIIAVSSYAGRVSIPFLDVYSSSKFAVEGFLESVSSVCRQFNISVSLLEPGLIKTKMLLTDIVSGVQEMTTDESVDELDRRLAKDWMGWAMTQPLHEPSYVAEAILGVIDAEKPVLRYQLPSELFESVLAEPFRDLTGEKIVKYQSLSIGIKE